MRQKLKKIIKKEFVILLLFVLVGLFIRIYHLADVPMYGDELTIVLDANSLLHTGHDQTGQLLPLTFSMGAGRPAGYVYGSIPFVALFGINVWGVRGLSLLSGLVLIWLIYLLGKRLYNSKIGLIAAALVTFSFWDINLSRGGFEAHFALMLAVLGLLGLFYAFHKPWWLLLSAFCFGVVLHTYPTYKVVLPLFLVCFFIIYFKEYRKLWKEYQKYFLGSLVLFILFALLAGLQTFTSSSETRFFSINVFSDPQIHEQIMQKVNSERTTSTLPSTIASLFHNRQLEYLKIIGQNYIHNLGFDFLFLNGDKNPRHNMATVGYFYLIEILTIIFGFIALLLKKQWKTMMLLIGWVIVAPVATALISDPHGLRSAFLLPALVLVSAGGIAFILEQKKMYRITISLIILCFVVQFIYFGEKLYFLAPNAFGSFWADSGKFATEEVLRQAGSYDYVVLSDKIDSIEYAYPAYAKVSAQEVIDQHPKNEHLLGTDYNFKKFGKVYIGDLPVEQLKEMGMSHPNTSILYVGTIEDKDKLTNYTTLRSCEQKEILVVSSINH